MCVALRAALMLIATLAWYVTLAPNSLGGPVGVIWVSGTSMEPTMHTGDLAVVYERSSYRVGDVVAFEIPGGGTVIHRIIEASDQGYRFQGDNRDFADPWLLDADAIIGEQVALIPRAGTIVTLLGQPPAMAVCVAAMVLLWAIGRRHDHHSEEAKPEVDGCLHVRLPSGRSTPQSSSAVDHVRLDRVGLDRVGLGRFRRRTVCVGVSRQGIASRYGDMSMPG